MGCGGSKPETTAPSASTSSTMSYTLFYHTACTEFLGRAHGPLMILYQGDAKFEIKLPEEAPENGIGFAPPMITFPGGFTIAQQASLCATLGKELGLYPKDAEGEAIALNIVLNMADLTNDMPPYPMKPEERILKWLGTFEAALAKYKSGYLVGDALTYADLASYYIVMSAAEKVKAPELVSKWLEMMAETKGAKACKATGLPLLPPGA